MEIGIYTFAELQEDPLDGHMISPQQRMLDLMEEAELAEQVGLDVFGVGEHHRADLIVSSPAVVLAAVAAPSASGSPARSPSSAPTIPSACSRISPRSTCCPMVAPRSWPVVAPSLSRSRYSATT